MILARCVDLWNVSWPVDLRAWKYQNGLDGRLEAGVAKGVLAAELEALPAGVVKLEFGILGLKTVSS